MEDKQKQIEEMAIDIHKHFQYIQADWKDSTKMDLSLAFYLYNAGYRKIPEGAVVLTRGEIDAYEERISSAYELGYKESKNRVVKETAEKFAERVKEETDHGISALYDSTVDKIAKEITEGV